MSDWDDGMRQVTLARGAEHTITARAVFAATVAGLLVLSACGGSGGSTPPAAGGNDSISGSVVKGPVEGGVVTAFAVTGGAKGAQLGTATTDAQGRFTMSLGDHAGAVMLQMAGGRYTDEATGSPMPMMTGDTMTACVPSVAAGAATSGIEVTPLTSMACARATAMPGGMTDANIDAANAAMGSYFAVNDILHTAPMDPLVAGSGAGASQDARNYGMAIAAMSQYAKTAGMTTSSSGMVTAMTNDASDGTMNGMMGASPVSMSGMGGMMGGNMQASAGTSSLADAMSQFTTSAMNRSGASLADMQPMIDKLRSSNGTIR